MNSSVIYTNTPLDYPFSREETSAARAPTSPVAFELNPLSTMQISNKTNCCLPKLFRSQQLPYAQIFSYQGCGVHFIANVFNAPNQD